MNLRVFLIAACLSSTAVLAEPQHLVLVTVDTLRADAVGTYGRSDNPTPNIDSLAKNGTLFEDAESVIGKTGPSFSTSFTSLFPPTHGARRNGVPMRDDIPTLATSASAAGYDTAAFITNWTLRHALSGLGRGFDHYDETFNLARNSIGAVERDAGSVTRTALEWLTTNRSSSKAPVLLWVHFSEPHTPFESHPTFMAPQPEKGDRSKGWEKRYRYDSEVRFTDFWIGKLLEGLNTSLPMDDTLLVFISDHGESLGEHGYWGHGKNAYRPNLRVPMILSGPGIPDGRRVKTPVSLVDLTPTILELLKLPPLPEAAGESLVPMLAGNPARQARPRFAFGDRPTALNKKQRDQYEDPLVASLEYGDLKAIFDFSRSRVEYYDLVRDPRELKPLAESPRKDRPSLGRQLSDWYKKLVKYATESGEFTDEDVKELRSLGYVGGH